MYYYDNYYGYKFSLSNIYTDVGYKNMLIHDLPKLVFNILDFIGKLLAIPVVAIIGPPY
jgi:hypothetical protein